VIFPVRNGEMVPVVPEWAVPSEWFFKENKGTIFIKNNNFLE